MMMFVVFSGEAVVVAVLAVAEGRWTGSPVFTTLVLVVRPPITTAALIAAEAAWARAEAGDTSLLQGIPEAHSVLEEVVVAEVLR